MRIPKFIKIYTVDPNNRSELIQQVVVHWDRWGRVRAIPKPV